MTWQELEQQRRAKWRLDGRPVRALEEARDFVESVGFCLMYPVQPPLVVPTFVGAFVGGEEHLPQARQAFADPRAREATELMVRLLRERSAYEGNSFGESNFLVAASLFPYFFGLVGDRNPKQVRSGGREKYSPLTADVFAAIRKQGPISKPGLQEALGGALSSAALDRALNELWSRLVITRVDYQAGQGAFWDTLERWAPEAVRAGIQVSVAESLSALVSRYLDSVVAAEAREVEEFFSRLVPRSKTRDAVNALLAARELQFLAAGKHSLLAVTPPRESALRGPRSERKAR